MKLLGSNYRIPRPQNIIYWLRLAYNAHKENLSFSGTHTASPISACYTSYTANKAYTANRTNTAYTALQHQRVLHFLHVLHVQNRMSFLIRKLETLFIKHRRIHTNQKRMYLAAPERSATRNHHRSNFGPTRQPPFISRWQQVRTPPSGGKITFNESDAHISSTDEAKPTRKTEVWPAATPGDRRLRRCMIHPLMYRRFILKYRNSKFIKLCRIKSYLWSDIHSLTCRLVFLFGKT